MKFDEEVLHLLGRVVLEFNSLESDWKHAYAVLTRNEPDPRLAAPKGFRDEELQKRALQNEQIDVGETSQHLP